MATLPQGESRGVFAICCSCHSINGNLQESSLLFPLLWWCSLNPSLNAGAAFHHLLIYDLGQLTYLNLSFRVSKKGWWSGSSVRVPSATCLVLRHSRGSVNIHQLLLFPNTAGCGLDRRELETSYGVRLWITNPCALDSRGGDVRSLADNVSVLMLTMSPGQPWLSAPHHCTA